MGRPFDAAAGQRCRCDDKQVKRNGRTVKARLGMNRPLKVAPNRVLAEFTRDSRRSFDSSRFTVTRAVNGLLRVAAHGVPAALGEVAATALRCRPGPRSRERQAAQWLRPSTAPLSRSASSGTPTESPGNSDPVPG